MKPDTVAKKKPTGRGGGGASARGGNSVRIARNNSVMPPTNAATVLALSVLNSNAPTSVPSSPAGTSRRSSARSRSCHSALMPKASMISSSGSMMAAACGTGTASAISGTPSAPKPAPKPLLLTPTSSTAGIATA